ncbi:claudin-34-like [Cynoglossus semilaevis]|uniref:claudin-34-like n=1 Tax=Cynoglossus semilaevis TaxID=244447 RepID=UPI0004952E3E|nr:claudin-34-like [Cynoglossus semilaevis]
MTSFAHTAHPQLVALWLSCFGWTLTAMALGLDQWRVWLVSDRDIITSGMAWVGLWRACFHSHTVVSPGSGFTHCRSISLTEAFTPPEIVSGQILMVLSFVVGLLGNAGGIYALRNTYFGLEANTPVRLSFCAAGALCLLAAAISLIPLMWNLSSVVTNQTIAFPPEFQLPAAPQSQYVGYSISLGVVGTVLMFASGIIFCRYKLPQRQAPSVTSSPEHDGADSGGGRENTAFEFNEHF